MSRKYWRGREIDIGPDESSEDPLAPDERDRDLMDGGIWGRRDTLPGRARSRAIRVGLAALSILALASLLIPMLAVVLR
ncbi:MAG: hypothetical protein ACE5EF_00335 [Dehalococcoidia bacterium]